MKIFHAISIARLLILAVSLASLSAWPFAAAAESSGRSQSGVASSRASEADFPVPPELEGDVRFWRRVYTEVGTTGGFIHDARDLEVVYQLIRFPAGTSAKNRERLIERSKRIHRDILRGLSRGKRTNLSTEERRVLALFPDGVGNQVLRTAASNIRFQLGQADKFRAGLIRAGAWRAQILATLREMDLPEELVALPHVESSYTPHAYSSVGAAGLWQFTRSTGRRYMRVDHVVDERMDPHRATVAAARLLAHNKKSTGTWPLALTAYNHGAAGMRRAARQLGTTDIGVIARKYKSRTFGFASRNFYVEFLAALEVDRNAEHYFGKLVPTEPVDYDIATVPAFVPAKPLAAAVGVDRDTLRDHNPALRSAVWSGSKRVPKGFALRLPRNLLERPLTTLLAGIPSPARYASQTRDAYHKVRRGESLSKIAMRYNVRVSDLVHMNGLRSAHSIRAGQTLSLPEGADRARARVEAAAKPRIASADGTYTVRRGDTVSSIASQFGTSERSLIDWNRLANRNRIAIGQRLRVAPAPAVAVKGPQELADAAPGPSSRTEYTPREATREELREPWPGLSERSPDEGGNATGKADPNDYSVAADGSIEIQATETLGHYAEWLDLRASRLRSLNNMRYGTPLAVGERVQLDFSQSSRQEFEARRSEHHQALQQAFFAQHEIVGTKTHVVRSGDSIWTLAQRRYDVPLWLVRQYNPDVDFGDLHAGEQLSFPTVRPR